MLNFTETIPLSLYIHLPWCVRKCPYCDFNSHVARGEIPEQVYIQRLIADLELDLPNLWGRRLSSIFIGGGTPSLFSPAALERLLTAIHTRLPFNADLEITLEANPGTVEQSRFKDFRAAGINRLSLGIQSFQDDKLKALGRIHDSATAIKAVEAAQQAGFTNINIDLMHGLPQQTLDDALFDVTTALMLQPNHFSWYQLTLEPNTLFHLQPPPLPKDDDIWQMQTIGQAKIAAAGFQQYEVSAYSLAGFQCQHNRNYWEFGDYLGIGAGAHSKLTLATSGQIVRAWRLKNPRSYLNAHLAAIAHTQVIAAADLPFEFMLNALRLQQAISFDLFEQRTGLQRSVIMPQLSLAAERQLLKIDEEYFGLTELGQRFLNDVVALFMPE